MSGLWRTAWRSRPGGHAHIDFGHWVIVTVILLLGPAGVGFALFKGTQWIFPVASDPAEMVWIQFFGITLLGSPIYGVFSVPASLLLLSLALRRGWAGWATVLLVALAVHLPILTLYFEGAAARLLPALGVFGPVIAFYALAMWLLVRIFCPNALREDPSDDLERVR